MFLQDPPHGLLPLQLLLPPQVEDQQSQQDEEEHHATHWSRDRRTRSKQKEIVQHSSWKNPVWSGRNLYEIHWKTKNLLRQMFCVVTVKVSHPVLVSMGQPLSSITVQLKRRNIRCEIVLIVCAVCACSRVFAMCVHSRQCAVGVAGQTVSCRIAVLPHSLLILLHTAGTMVHTELPVLELSTLCTMFCTLKTRT